MLRYSWVLVTVASTVSVIATENYQLGAAQATSQQNRQNAGQGNAVGNRNGNNIQASQTRQAGEAASEENAGQGKNMDRDIATCVAIANQEEIALAQLAEQKSQSPEIKQFAEMMLRDHQEYLIKLQKYAPDAARPGFLGDKSRTDATEATETSRRDTNSTGARQTTNQAGTRSDANRTEPVREQGREGVQNHTAMISMEREIAQECLASAKQKLNGKSGAEFDKCFIHMQVAKHSQMKDKLNVFERHASRGFAEILMEGKKTTEQHLAKAEEIEKSLERGGSSGRTRGQGEANERSSGKKSE